MQDEGRLWIDRRAAAKNLLGRVLIDFTILAGHGVHGLGDVDGHNLALGIEDNDDVTPVVTSCIVLQHKSDDT